MPKELERDLGLYAVLTISIGAMIGSGIFVLPGLAAKIAGPAVVLAYLLAGLLVLPATLSKSELASAMPESGGTYLFIDRAMGPLLGTIAGLGAWFTLVFKSAFALAGLGAYLLLVVPGVDPTLVALALAVGVVAINVVGVKQSGRAQAIVVSVVLAVLVLFVADGITYVDSTRYHPFVPHGGTSVLAAAGFVFVSYAGVTKIASVAEEIEDPGRTIPLGMLASIGVMMLLYTLVVFVVVGLSEPTTLHETLTPMAGGAERLFGGWGEQVVVAVAVLALASMANAGVLSASRYPLALARDDLAPPALAGVSDRFSTPVAAIGLTGAVLLALVAFVPVVELAKLASAFQILVFAFVNVALIAFRESDLEAYDPEFVAPGYPWVQLAGIGGGLLLVTQMGRLPMLGAAGIVVAGAVWYRVYGRARTEREGAALDAIRRSSSARALDRTRSTYESPEAADVLVPIGRGDGARRGGDVEVLVALAAAIAGRHGGVVRVVRFDEVPQQLGLSAASESEIEFRPDPDGRWGDVDARVEYAEVVTHDTKRSVASVAETHDVDLVLGQWHPSRWRAELLGVDVDWYMHNAPCDVAFVRNRGLDDVDRIVLVADQGPYDPLEVVLADSVAVAHDATLSFVATLSADAGADRLRATEEYLDELVSFPTAPTETHLLTTDDRVDALVGASAGADLVVAGSSAHHVLYDVLFGSVPDRLAQRLDRTVVLAHSRRPRRHTFLRALLDRFVF